MVGQREGGSLYKACIYLLSPACPCLCRLNASASCSIRTLKSARALPLHHLWCHQPSPSHRPHIPRCLSFERAILDQALLELSQGLTRLEQVANKAALLAGAKAAETGGLRQRTWRKVAKFEEAAGVRTHPSILISIVGRRGRTVPA